MERDINSLLARMASLRVGFQIISDDSATTSAHLVELVEHYAKDAWAHAVQPGQVIPITDTDPVRFTAKLLAALVCKCTALPIPASCSEQTKLQLRSIHRNVGMSGVIHMTSGSIGASKLIVRPVENLIDEGIAVADRLDLSVISKLVVTSPLQHSYGSGLLFAALYSGAILFTATQPNIYERIGKIRYWLDHQPNVIAGVPYTFHLILHGWRAQTLGSDTLALSGGEPLPERLAWLWQTVTGSPLRQEYGLSEGGIVSIADREDPVSSVGRPLDGIDITVDPLTSEILVDRDYSHRLFYLDGERPATDALFRIPTGDLGYIENDRLFITGRSKSVIIVAGMKVVPEEVSLAICELPDVVDAFTTAIPDVMSGQRPISAVLSSNRFMTVADVRQWLHGRLEHYKIPVKILLLDEFPRLPSGKVDKHELSKWLSIDR